MLKFMSKLIILMHLFNIGKAQRGQRKERRYYIMTLCSREKMSVTHACLKLMAKFLPYFHLKEPEKEENTKTKVTRRKKVITIREI